MTDFNGYNGGCSGEARISAQEYGAKVATFEAKGRAMGPSDGTMKRPDAIRVTSVDEQGNPLYRDIYYAFSEEEAHEQLERRDCHTPFSNLSILEDGQIEQLNAQCGDCTQNIGLDCPVLAAIIESTGWKPIES